MGKVDQNMGTVDQNMGKADLYMGKIDQNMGKADQNLGKVADYDTVPFFAARYQRMKDFPVEKFSLYRDVVGWDSGNRDTGFGLVC